MRLRARPEQELQRTIFEHRRMRAAPGVFAFHPVNGGYRKPIRALACLEAWGILRSRMVSADNMVDI